MEELRESCAKHTWCDTLLHRFTRPLHEQIVLRSPSEFRPLISSGLPVVVTMCVPHSKMCEIARDGLVDAGKALYGRVHIVWVDCSQHASLCESRQVQTFPTIEVFHSIPNPEDPTRRTVRMVQMTNVEYCPTGLRAFLLKNGFLLPQVQPR